MLVYHVSRCPEPDRIKTFTPRIPWSVGPDEDVETPRVCVSGSVLGALAAIMLSDDIIDNGEGFMVFSANVPEDEMIGPEELVEYYGVLDAMCTQEYWVTKPITMVGNMYRITGYERGNYLMPFPEYDGKVRECLRKYPAYKESMTLHELLNEFIYEVGIDEDDFVEEFGIKGIRVFTKIKLEVV